MRLDQIKFQYLHTNSMTLLISSLEISHLLGCSSSPHLKFEASALEDFHPFELFLGFT